MRKGVKKESFSVYTEVDSLYIISIFTKKHDKIFIKTFLSLAGKIGKLSSEKGKWIVK